MHTMTIKLTDLEYKSITTEAAKRSVSPEEVIDDWLIEGELATVPFRTEEPFHGARHEGKKGVKQVAQIFEKSFAAGKISILKSHTLRAVILKVWSRRVHANL